MTLLRAASSRASDADRTQKVRQQGSFRKSSLLENKGMQKTPWCKNSLYEDTRKLIKKALPEVPKMRLTVWYSTHGVDIFAPDDPCFRSIEPGAYVFTCGRCNCNYGAAKLASELIIHESNKTVSAVVPISCFYCANTINFTDVMYF